MSDLTKDIIDVVAGAGQTFVSVWGTIHPPAYSTGGYSSPSGSTTAPAAPSNGTSASGVPATSMTPVIIAGIVALLIILFLMFMMFRG
ncbi:MAG: hypothetical protein WC530_07910 [Candidatus Omnitrophota bacterium]|jgi:hypothetical protein